MSNIQDCVNQAFALEKKYNLLIFELQQYKPLQPKRDISPDLSGPVEILHTTFENVKESLLTLRDHEIEKALKEWHEIKYSPDGAEMHKAKEHFEGVVFNKS
jgi:hypothetical protein